MRFVRLYVYLTQKCNFKCKHCFIRQTNPEQFRNPKEIDFDLLVKFLQDFGVGAKSVNFTGDGNPILYSRIGDALRVAKRMVGHVSINTRGYIPKEVLKAIAETDTVIYYSMDWFGKKADEEMGFDNLWDIQMRMLNIFAGLKLKVAVRSTLMRDNYGDIMQLIRLVENFRLRGFDFSIEIMPYLPYHNEERRPTLAQVKSITEICLTKFFTRLLTPWWTCIYPLHRDRASRWWDKIHGGRLCEAGRDYGRIAIKEDGTLLPCPFEVKPIGKYEYVEREWVLNREQLEIEIEKYLEETPVDKSCKECIFFKYCGGGCRVVNNLGYEQICPVRDIYEG